MIKKATTRLLHRIKATCDYLLDVLDPPKPTYQTIKNDRDGFFRWVSNRPGNVFQLWEDYLSQTLGVPCCVGFDWVYCATDHDKNDEGVIVTWDKHPRWFRQWIKDNGKGRDKADYDPK